MTCWFSESTGSLLAPVLLRLLQFFQCPIFSLPGLRRKSSAKLRRIFELAKFFGVFLNFSIFGGVSPFQGRPGTSVPKSECKVRRSPRTSQIFRQVFSRKFQPEEGQSTVATGGQGIGRGGEKDGQWRSPAALSPPCGQTPNCMEGTGSFESAFFFDQEEFFLGG